jgi:magnesium transporter
MENQDEIKDHLNHITALIEAGDLREASTALAELHPAEIAHLLESLPYDKRLLTWELVDPDHDGDVLAHVKDEVRGGLIRTMDAEELIAATENLDADDLADILPDLPEAVMTELLQSMDEQNRDRLESILQYPEDTAGGLMNVDVITIRPDVSLDVILRYIRFHGSLPDSTDVLFVVNRTGKYLGVLRITDLLTHDESLTVAEVMNRDIRPLTASADDHEVAQLFEKRDLISAPVVDDEGRLLGRITIDDVVDVIRDEADHSFMSLAGLDEEDDIFAPVVRSTRRRTVWLGVNLLTALLASYVIGLFGATIERLVALAILMPIVASMGGIAGSQTLTIVIRGIALGHVGKSNRFTLLRKELAVGALNGIIWAVVVGLLALAWFDNTKLGIIIGCAILFNLFVAALAGATIPIVLYRFGADPALAGGVVLTTVTDVVGFFAFLGLAALFLL